MSTKYGYHIHDKDDSSDCSEHCSPNFICAELHSSESDRQFGETLEDHCDPVLNGSSNSESDSSPARTPSPTLTSLDSDDFRSTQTSRETRGRCRSRYSDVHVNVSYASSPSPHLPASSPRPRPSYPPRSMPIPISRAATMSYGSPMSPSDRGRRPIVVDPRYSATQQYSPNNTPRVMPTYLYGPTDIYTHSARRDPRDFRGFRDPREPPESRLSREFGARDARNTHYYYNFRDVRPAAHSMPTSFGRSLYPRSPDYYRSPERAGAARSPRDQSTAGHIPARRRREWERPIVQASSLPTMGSTGVYGSSHEPTASGTASSANAAAASSGSAKSSSPAADVKKEVRWKDEERRKQNDRIRSRPALPRQPPETATSPKPQGKLKSILKGSPSNANAEDGSRDSSRVSRSSYSRHAPSPAGNYHDDDLATGLSNLGLSSSSSRPPRRYDSRWS
ncbi:hypothetical protein SEPCBS119000_003170 [Sporothrix epigloea]|uniref:Uncharacterized protein n=1 Tax=Sporothrix epigloea TaxID=1892477 RepID=A0ABP0DKE1_9PEZI